MQESYRYCLLLVNLIFESLMVYNRRQIALTNQIFCQSFSFSYVCQAFKIFNLKKNLIIKNSSKYFYILVLTYQQIFMINSKHIVSCFDGTLNGWHKQSPDKDHKACQPNFLHQLQQNLYRYQDQNNKLNQQKNEASHVRLPILVNAKSNINIQDRRSHSKASRFDSELSHNHRKNQPLPLRMKTLMIYNIKENKSNEQEKIIKSRKRSILNVQSKQKNRKKVVINFERIKQIGVNCLQFSDNKFFKDNTTIQHKSKSVKLHFLERNF